MNKHSTEFNQDNSWLYYGFLTHKGHESQANQWRLIARDYFEQSRFELALYSQLKANRLKHSMT